MFSGKNHNGVFFSLQSYEKKRSLRFFPFCGTFGAQTFQHIVYAVQGEAFGQLYHGSRDVFHAKRPVASFTMEMCVQVFYPARAVGAAYGILERACPVVYAMYQVVGQELGQRPENADLSTVSSMVSSSDNDTGRLIFCMASSTSRRMAVGCMPRCANKSRRFLSSILCVVFLLQKYRKNVIFPGVGLYLLYQPLYPHGVHYGYQCYAYVGKDGFPQVGKACGAQQ